MCLKEIDFCYSILVCRHFGYIIKKLKLFTQIGNMTGKATWEQSFLEEQILNVENVGPIFGDQFVI